MTLPDSQRSLSPDRTVFRHLLSPLRAAGVTLPNRVVMGAMHTRLEAADSANHRIRLFYRRRADGEVGMIITGGVAPNPEGRVEPDSPVMLPNNDTVWHAAIVGSVRETPTIMCMQILHTGRYARFSDCVAPSALKARISRYTPRALSTAEVWRTIEDYARTAAQSRELGYQAVEIMGSEGYLINQFTAPVTNMREDEFGVTFEGRVRFPLEILKAVRRRVGPDFPIIYRISAADLVNGGMRGEETLRFARLIEEAGADILNTGFGWHESTVPTVAHVVPRAAFAYAVRRIKLNVSIPVIASNRINDPNVAEALVRDGAADLVSMARPLLADPDFVRKMRLGKAASINTCIACNQSCLDHVFREKTASCLVNPQAGHELDFLSVPPPAKSKRIAIVGGGCAGMTAAITAASRGHKVVLYEASQKLGGQLLLARRIPGKSEFDELLRYFSQRLDEERVDIRRHTVPTVAELTSSAFDEIIVATGVRPRFPQISGIKHPKVVDYASLLTGSRAVGRQVAIIGAGGIGFDVADYLLNDDSSTKIDDFAAEYGLDVDLKAEGGLAKPQFNTPERRVTLLQRKSGPLGVGLGASTGWIHRNRLKRLGVELLAGVKYEHIDDDGLHIVQDGQARVLPADIIVICAGQESERTILTELMAHSSRIGVHSIGGADLADELDAARAIDQATRLAFAL